MHVEHGEHGDVEQEGDDGDPVGVDGHVDTVGHCQTVGPLLVDVVHLEPGAEDLGGDADGVEHDEGCVSQVGDDRRAHVHLFQPVEGVSDNLRDAPGGHERHHGPAFCGAVVAHVLQVQHEPHDEQTGVDLRCSGEHRGSHEAEQRVHDLEDSHRLCELERVLNHTPDALRSACLKHMVVGQVEHVAPGDTTDQIVQHQVELVDYNILLGERERERAD